MYRKGNGCQWSGLSNQSGQNTLILPKLRDFPQILLSGKHMSLAVALASSGNDAHIRILNTCPSPRPLFVNVTHIKKNSRIIC